MGIIESRKGLIWGPFCPVYGVGAIILIILLNKVDQKNYLKLFLYGFFIGSAVEYLLSYGLESIYGSRFWDYSYTGKDLNGRICIIYSLFWGILSLLLMKIVKPSMDQLIAKISTKIKGPIEIILFLFLVIDAICTVWAVSTYEQRVLNNYYNKPIPIHTNQNWFTNIKTKIENEYFTNEKMQKTFPNLRVKDEQGKEIWIKDMIK